METENTRIDYCPARRRIWLTMSGNVAEIEELEAFQKAMDAPLADLAGGFDLVVPYDDGVRPFTDAELRQIFAVYGAWRSMGLRFIARVATDRQRREILPPVDQTADEVGIATMNFASRDAADRYLDALPALAA